MVKGGKNKVSDRKTYVIKYYGLCGILKKNGKKQIL